MSGERAAAAPDPSSARFGPPGVPNRPRLALSVEEACAALGVGWDLWRAHIEPEVKVVRVGRRKLVAVAELERWLDRRGERIGERP